MITLTTPQLDEDLFIFIPLQVATPLGKRLNKITIKVTIIPWPFGVATLQQLRRLKLHGQVNTSPATTPLKKLSCVVRLRHLSEVGKKIYYLNHIGLFLRKSNERNTDFFLQKSPAFYRK